MRTCGLEPSITGPSSFGFCGPARRSITVRRRPQCGVHRLRQTHVPPQRRSHRPPAHRSGDELPQLRNPQAQPGRRGLRGDADDPAPRPGRDHRQRRPDGRGRVPHHGRGCATISTASSARCRVFAKTASASENSLIGSGRSLSVENNYGYQDPFGPHTGAITRPGLRADGHQKARQRLRAGVDKPHRERPQHGYQSSPRQPRPARALGASASGANQPRAHGSTSPPPRLSPPPLSCHFARSRETAPPGDSGREIRASPRSAPSRYAAGTRQHTYLREHECGSRLTHRPRPAIRHNRASGACRSLANAPIKAVVGAGSRSRSRRGPISDNATKRALLLSPSMNEGPLSSPLVLRRDGACLREVVAQPAWMPAEPRPDGVPASPKGRGWGGRRERCSSLYRFVNFEDQV